MSGIIYDIKIMYQFFFFFNKTAEMENPCSEIFITSCLLFKCWCKKILGYRLSMSVFL